MLRSFIFVLVVMLGAQTADGRTWFVEKDGLGDYTVIQDALDAAADGDTVKIGVGHFSDYRMYTYGGGWRYCYVNIENSDLTIIGSGMDATVIGPEEEWWDFDNQSIGLVQVSPLGNGASFQDLTTINTLLGSEIASNRRFEFQRVKFCHNRIYGALIFGTGNITDCFFDDFYNIALSVHSPAENILVENCDFQGRYGLSLSATDNISVRNCRFDCVSSGLAEYCTGGLYDSKCNSSMGNGFSFFGPNEFLFRGNELIGFYHGLYLSNNPENIIVEDNYIKGGLHPALLISKAQPLSIKNNDIIRGSGYAVALENYTQEVFNIDLTDNYWGTTDPEEIAAGILDGHTDSSIHAYVIFDPYCGSSVPAENISLDGLKALFRDATR